MIIKAKKKHNINLKTSFMIGDQKSDEMCAKKAKVIFFYKKNNFNKDIKKILKKFD